MRLIDLFDIYYEEHMSSENYMKRRSFDCDCITLEGMNNLIVPSISEAVVARGIFNEFTRYREDHKMTFHIRYILKFLSRILNYYIENYDRSYENPVPGASKLLKNECFKLKKRKKVKEKKVAKKVKKDQKMKQVLEVRISNAFDDKLAFANKLSEALGREGQALKAICHKHRRSSRPQKTRHDIARDASTPEEKLVDHDKNPSI